MRSSEIHYAILREKQVAKVIKTEYNVTNAMKTALEYESVVLKSVRTEAKLNSVFTHKSKHHSNKNFNYNTKKDVTCFKCKKSGHKANECRSMTYQPREAEPQKKKITCYKCKKEGHYASKCSSIIRKVNIIETINLVNAAAATKELLFVDARIVTEGLVIKVKALLDPGATISTISNKLVKQHRIAVRESDTVIQTINNSSKALGWTEAMEIDVHSHICKVPFYVIEKDHYDLILGLNWFHALGAGVKVCEGRPMLTFSEESFALDDLTPVDDDEVKLDLTSNIMQLDTLDEENIDDVMNFPIESNPIIQVNKNLTKDQRNAFKKLEKLILESCANSLNDLESAK